MPIARFLCAVTLLFITSAVHAIGMTEQPVPKPEAIRDALRYSQDIASPNGDKGRSRPQLLVLIETNPAADLVEKFAPALRDANTYTAILATYDDTLIAETDPKRQTFIRYNILRTILARAVYLPTVPRRALMTRATVLAETLAKENKTDAAVWEATGDLYALKDDTQNAVAAYRRMAGTGSASLASYKTAQAYQRARNWDQARAAYESGVRADATQGASASGKETRHLLYQGLASVYLAEGRDKNAADALLLSIRVKPDAEVPYPFRLDVAEALLKRGYAKQVVEYADAILKITPDDEGAQRLRASANAAVR